MSVGCLQELFADPCCLAPGDFGAQGKLEALLPERGSYQCHGKLSLGLATPLRMWSVGGCLSQVLLQAAPGELSGSFWKILQLTLYLSPFQWVSDSRLEIILCENLKIISPSYSRLLHCSWEIGSCIDCCFFLWPAFLFCFCFVCFWSI